MRDLSLQKAAYQAVQGALRRGELVRPKVCPRCGKRRPVQAHHDDHTKPIDVKWECTRCHAEGRRAVILEYHISPEVRARAICEGIPLRALILQLLATWLASAPAAAEKPGA